MTLVEDISNRFDRLEAVHTKEFQLLRQQREAAWFEMPVVDPCAVASHDAAFAKRSQDDHSHQVDDAADRAGGRSSLGTASSSGALASTDELGLGGAAFEGVD